MRRELIVPIQYAASDHLTAVRFRRSVQAIAWVSSIAIVFTGTMIALHRDAAHSGVRRRGTWRRKSGFAPPRL
jgi:hypothetical protein